VFDVLIGINLLREGLDIPEVSLVAILDADKEGFLRSTRSIIQTCGRAARNVTGTVILYADQLTDSIRQAVAESNRRRRIQMEYNKAHNIIPTTISKQVDDILYNVCEADYVTIPKVKEEDALYMSEEEFDRLILRLTRQMKAAAKKLQFEEAAVLRDKIKLLQEQRLQVA